MTPFESVYRFFGWWIINIDMFFLALLLLGGLFLLFRRRKGGKRLVTTGCVGFFFLGIVPIGLWSLEVLENRFPKVHEIPSDVKGMILLGGSFDQLTTLARGETAYTLAAGNFIRFVELAKEYPQFQLVYTGTPTEAATAKQDFKALGIDPERVLFEGESKNTIENAQKTAALLNAKPEESWLLVTSAYHIPRATGLFRKIGVNVVPYPVDYHTPGNYEMWFFIGLKLNLDAWHAASREYLGMLLNYLMGRSDTLFPSST